MDFKFWMKPKISNEDHSFPHSEVPTSLNKENMNENKEIFKRILESQVKTLL